MHHVDTARANWMEAHIQTHMVEDETAIINLGDEVETEYSKLVMDSLQLSFFNDM